MSEKKAEVAAPLSPEAEANARIKEIQAGAVALQKEIRTIQGRFANRDPAAIRALQKENELLHSRLELLEKALVGLVTDSFKPRQAAEEQQQFEVLRDAAIDYCKKANVDPEIWKSLVS